MNKDEVAIDLKEERKELVNKIGKISNKIIYPEDISNKQLGLLKKQRKAMTDYESVLDERINDLTED